MNIEDILQARINLLESGESLDACIDGAPQEVVEALKLVNYIRSLELPQIDPDIAALQRSRLMSMKLPLSSQPAMYTEKGKKNHMPFWKKLNPLTLAITFSAVAVFMICAVITIGIGGLWFMNREVHGLVQNAPASSPAPLEAVLTANKGLVEILDGDQWLLASEVHTSLKPGMHIRTGMLSSTTLSLFDGSQVRLGPNSELVIDKLQVQPADGPRMVVFTQLAGTSEHQVAHVEDVNARYEVQTAAATGTALGTDFKVQVKPNQESWFSVLDGKISVTGNDETVVVEAGKVTYAAPDEPPIEPEYFFTGSGKVSYIGETWVIAGQILVTTPGTTIIGNPLVGDLVLFEGHLLPDDTRVVDLIVLLRRSPENKFSLTGRVTSNDGSIWVVDGQDIAVTDITDVQDGIKQNDLVLVEGLILEGGDLQAEKITKLEEQPGYPFEFQGIVEDIDEPNYVISGIQVRTDENTTIDKDLAQGELVKVSGWVLEDGTWLAKEIIRVVDESRAFEFTGQVQSKDPWVVAGVSLETRDWTHIDAGIEQYDRVKVSGQILEDGTWLAYEITRVEEVGEVRFILVGNVTNMHPWVVSGTTLTIDDKTTIDPGITLGMLVRVEIIILPDGSWKIVSIQPVEGYILGFGCHEIVAQLVNFANGQIQLKGWPEIPLGDDLQETGDFTPNSILLLQICFDEDGSVTIISIIVIYQPPAEEIEEPEQPELPNEKVMICHKPNGKNPHTIVVSQSAVPAHLGHGDFIGPCP